MSNGRSLKWENIVPIILSIVAAVLYLVGQIGYLCYWYYDIYGEVPITEIVFEVIWAIPYLLLIVHLILYQIRRIQIMFSFVFIAKLFFLISSMLRYFEFYGWHLYDYIDILRIIECAGCIGIIFDSFATAKKRYLSLCLVCILGIFNVIYFVYYLSIYLSWNIYEDNTVYNCMVYIGSIIFYIVSIVHIVLVKRKRVSSVAKNNVMGLEQMLVDIKQQYEAGTITEQEYHNRKSNIISKL